jgi:hypothetical protein
MTDDRACIVTPCGGVAPRGAPVRASPLATRSPVRVWPSRATPPHTISRGEDPRIPPRGPAAARTPRRRPSPRRSGSPTVPPQHAPSARSRPHHLPFFALTFSPRVSARCRLDEWRDSRRGRRLGSGAAPTPASQDPNHPAPTTHPGLPAPTTHPGLPGLPAHPGAPRAPRAPGLPVHPRPPRAEGWMLLACAITAAIATVFAHGKPGGRAPARAHGTRGAGVMAEIRQARMAARTRAGAPSLRRIRARAQRTASARLVATPAVIRVSTVSRSAGPSR